MRISSLFDQGSAAEREDAHLVSNPFCVVADGVSAPYNSETPLRRFEGKPGGQMAADTVVTAYASAQTTDEVGHCLKLANMRVGQIQSAADLSLESADLLAGAGVVAAKLTGDAVEIVWVGDTAALWWGKGGIGKTRDQVARHDEWAEAEFARHLEAAGGNHGQAWETYHEVRLPVRRRDVNGEGELAFGVVNGQPKFALHIEEVSLQCNFLDVLILCSDGFLRGLKTGDVEACVRQVRRAYDVGGLAEGLKRVRDYELVKAKKSHAAHAEVTAIAIEFR